MGFYTESGIRKFRPDNTDKILYIPACGLTLLDIFERAGKHFDLVDLSNLQITSEHIQTDCIGYDCYDSGDYTAYIVIEKID